jgi:predicted acylesterase/phospholipase RssA
MNNPAEGNSTPAQERELGHESQQSKGPKRAICLAGGGPAAGLHIGVLEGLKKRGITFDNEESVWALSCIGAWVGVIYNQANEGEEIEQTKRFFRDVFRDDKSFKSFPTNTIFAPDWLGNAEAMIDFMLEPENYRNAFLPREIMKSYLYTMAALRRQMSATRRRRYKFRDGEFEESEEFEGFDEGDFNRWTLNQILAVNPAVRFLTALMYKSKVDGLSKLYYPDSKLLRDIKFNRLYDKKKPFIFHNAWNLSKQELVLFANRPVKDRDYRRMSAASLCACSALPFIEQTVTIDDDIYCEGALIDTVNFRDLLKDHPELDEIWISRIVDADQILPPRNLHDSLANLSQLFAATVGEDDVKLFKYHVKFGEVDGDGAKAGPTWTGTIVEIPVASDINFEWSRSNLQRGIESGADAAEQAFAKYRGRADIAVPRAERSNPIIIEAPNRECRMKQRRERPGFEDRLNARLGAGRADP